MQGERLPVEASVGVVVPSMVVEYIDLMFPWARQQEQDALSGAAPTLTSSLAGRAQGIVDLVDEVPPWLLRVGGDELVALLVSISELRVAIARWEGGHSFDVVTAYDNKKNPVTHIRHAMSLCPDEAPTTQEATLKFVADSVLRENLRTDLASANAALADGHWKAATVLAGSVVEALLLDRLQREDRERRAEAIEALLNADPPGLTKRPKKDPLEWGLHELVEIAAHLKVIEPRTVFILRIIKGFRNLIHPGRALRTSEKCNRGTTLAAVSGVEFVVEDLS